jgi:hypothetical protein
MSIDYQAEVETAQEERKQLCHKAEDKEDFMRLANESGLFEKEEDAENFWDNYLKWDAEQDNIGGGN